MLYLANKITIINRLLNLKANVTAFDPQSMINAKRILPQISYAKDVYRAIEGKHAMIIVTEWPEFSQIDLSKAKKLLKKPNIVDGRNIFDPHKAKVAGFKYIGVGR